MTNTFYANWRASRCVGFLTWFLCFFVFFVPWWLLESKASVEQKAGILHQQQGFFAAVLPGFLAVLKIWQQ